MCGNIWKDLLKEGQRKTAEEDFDSLLLWCRGLSEHQLIYAVGVHEVGHWSTALKSCCCDQVTLITIENYLIYSLGVLIPSSATIGPFYSSFPPPPLPHPNPLKFLLLISFKKNF
ncbi:hypothetical protein BsWGS_22451 [Bradybaena similaris]